MHPSTRRLSVPKGCQTVRSRYYNALHAMGRRKRDRQVAMWITTTALPTAASHPLYRRLNQLLREHGFDDFAEAQCGREESIYGLLGAC
jgi:hypothetical protein